MEKESLIQRAKLRDPDAFAKLMDQHMQGMYKTARAILQNDEDAADAIQDTILTCWEKLAGLKEERYFKTWMNGNFYLPSRELTEEDLLQIVDFRKKQEYVFQRIGNDIQIGKRTGWSKIPEK